MPSTILMKSVASYNENNGLARACTICVNPDWFMKNQLSFLSDLPALTMREIIKS